MVVVVVAAGGLGLVDERRVDGVEVGLVGERVS